jgi:hypothetical protein
VSGELGDGLGSFRDGVLGQLTGEDEFDGSLNFAGAHGVSTVVADQAGGFDGESVERVGNEGVHDGHGLLGDSGFGVDLLQHLVDVDAERFNSLSGSLLFNSLDVLGGGGGLSGWHFKLLFNSGVGTYIGDSHGF